MSIKRYCPWPFQKPCSSSLQSYLQSFFKPWYRSQFKIQAKKDISQRRSPETFEIFSKGRLHPPHAISISKRSIATSQPLFNQEASTETYRLFSKKNRSKSQHLPRKNGFWQKTPGSSLWFSNLPAVQAITKGQGIPFENGFPNFKIWSIALIYLNDLQEKQNDHLEADKILSKNWRTLIPPNQNFYLNKLAALDNTKCYKDQQLITFFRKKEKLTWHHHEDGITMMLLQTVLHQNIPHLGGAQIRKRWLALKQNDALSLEKQSFSYALRSKSL